MSHLKEYIDNLKNRIASKKNMEIVDIIRYVYIDLGKKMDFDLNYTFGNSKAKTKIYEKPINEQELNNIMETHTIICKSLAYLMERILKEFDIDISTAREDNVYNGKRRKTYV